MDISKREIVVVGVLLTVLTTALIYQWWFNPNTCWLRAEGQRKALREAESRSIAPTKERPLEELTRAAIAGYEAFARRFPKHPKTAAAWVIVAELEERLDWRSPHVLERRTRVAEFCGDKRAAEEVKRLLESDVLKVLIHHKGNLGGSEIVRLTELDLDSVPVEALACLEPLHFPPIPAADTLAQGRFAARPFMIYLADSSKFRGKVILQIPTCQQLVDGSQAWRHDLGQVAFATRFVRVVPGGSFIYYGARWTIWVADFKTGRLRAFLPSKPLPDLTKTEEPLLVWSADGKRLTCGGETFVVE